LKCAEAREEIKKLVDQDKGLKDETGFMTYSPTVLASSS